MPFSFYSSIRCQFVSYTVCVNHSLKKAHMKNQLTIIFTRFKYATVVTIWKPSLFSDKLCCFTPPSSNAALPMLLYRNLNATIVEGPIERNRITACFTRDRRRAHLPQTVGEAWTGPSRWRRVDDFLYKYVICVSVLSTI